MYKIEKHYINDHGIKIQYVVIDLCCAKVVAQYDSYENAEGWIIRKLIGEPKHEEHDVHMLSDQYE
jgi:hypothetical protein